VPLDEPEVPTQVAALALGSHVVVNTWDGHMEFFRSGLTKNAVVIVEENHRRAKPATQTPVRLLSLGGTWYPPYIGTECCLHIRERTSEGRVDRARKSKLYAGGRLLSVIRVESTWSPNPPETATGVQMESKSLSPKSCVFIEECL
jgi:hypothetical protein